MATNTNTKRRHFDTTQTAPHVDSQRRKAGVHRTITAAVAREIMAASYEGGRARCDYCYRYYSANYVKPVRAGNFAEKYACGWCRKHCKLQIQW